MVYLSALLSKKRKLDYFQGFQQFNWKQHVIGKRSFESNSGQNVYNKVEMSDGAVVAGFVCYINTHLSVTEIHLKR